MKNEYPISQNTVNQRINKILQYIFKNNRFLFVIVKIINIFALSKI